MAVVEEIRALEQGQRIAAARMLGLMSEREVGPERVNTVTALAGALEGMAPGDLRLQMG